MKYRIVSHMAVLSSGYATSIPADASIRDSSFQYGPTTATGRSGKVAETKRPAFCFDVVLKTHGWLRRNPTEYLRRTTEGFYDTASHRSQQASQHQTVYQKETMLPKRRCPRRCKPKHVFEASKQGKAKNAPMTKPWPCVKTMLCDRKATIQRGQRV